MMAMLGYSHRLQVAGDGWQSPTRKGLLAMKYSPPTYQAAVSTAPRATQRRLRRIALLFGLLVSVTIANVAHAQRYTYTDLSSLVNGNITAATLNNVGDLVINTSSGSNYLYHSHSASLTSLPFAAIDINDKGQILGDDGGTFILTGNTRNYLTLFGQHVSFGSFLNNSGDVAGNDNFGGEIWLHDGTIVPVLRLPGMDYAPNYVVGLDDGGNVAGMFKNPHNGNFEVFYAGKGYATSVPVYNDFGFVGALANGMSRNGTIVGTGYFYMLNPADPTSILDVNHPFLAHGGSNGVDILPNDPTSINGNGVNDLEQVIGATLGASGVHAVLVDNGTRTDLTSLVPELATFDQTIGWQINDRGQIYGTGQTGSVQTSFLLTPTASAPEPGTLALLAAVGLPAVGVATARRRIRRRLTNHGSVSRSLRAETVLPDGTDRGHGPGTGGAARTAGHRSGRASHPPETGKRGRDRPSDLSRPRGRSRPEARHFNASRHPCLGTPGGGDASLAPPGVSPSVTVCAYSVISGGGDRLGRSVKSGLAGGFFSSSSITSERAFSICGS
jgi:hypothetical protein